MIYDYTITFTRTYGEANPLRKGIETKLMCGAHTKEEAEEIVKLLEGNKFFDADATYHDFKIVESVVELSHTEHNLKRSRPR